MTGFLRAHAPRAGRGTTVGVAAAAALAGLVAFSPVSALAGDVKASDAKAADAKQANRFNEHDMLDAARRSTSANEARPVNIGVPPADELRVLEARREAELKRLSDKLKRAADARGPQKPDVLTEPTWATEVVVAPAEGIDVKQRSALGAQSDSGPTATSPEFGLKGVATVLMVLNSAADGRPLNPERAADPILCLDDGCYVSNGAQAQASFHSFSQSLSMSGRLGRGAGACNHAKGCVFRNVELGTGLAKVQPIDLKFVRHDRREQLDVVIDTSCKAVEGRLSCSRPVRAGSYTMWIVPEHVARQVGSDKLAEAVADGLLTSRTAELPWSSKRQ